MHMLTIVIRGYIQRNKKARKTVEPRNRSTQPICSVGRAHFQAVDRSLPWFVARGFQAFQALDMPHGQRRAGINFNLI